MSGDRLGFSRSTFQHRLFQFSLLLFTCCATHSLFLLSHFAPARSFLLATAFLPFFSFSQPAFCIFLPPHVTDIAQALGFRHNHGTSVEQVRRPV